MMREDRVVSRGRAERLRKGMRDGTVLRRQNTHVYMCG